MSPRGRAAADRDTGAVGLPPDPFTSPPARRSRRSRWRDPRLVVGVVVVAVCALLGARLLAGAADTAQVWAARRALHAGQPVGPDDVVRHRVRFADQADADRYVSAADELTGDLTAARDVGAGELLPRAALESGPRPTVTQVPLSVDAGQVPATVTTGATVDVWVTPDRTSSTGATTGATTGADQTRSSRVFHDVRVLAGPRSETSAGSAAARQVVVAVPQERLARLARSIAALSAGTVVLTVEQ